jgi:hypothetical protein
VLFFPQPFLEICELSSLRELQTAQISFPHGFGRALKGIFLTDNFNK